MATGHDVIDGHQLLQMPGWQTLMTILRESGESAPRKRVFDSPSSFHFGGGDGKNGNDRSLAKRLRAVSLK